MRHWLCIFCLLFSTFLESKVAELNPDDVFKKLQEIMKNHATHKKISPEIAKRVLQNYLEELDPNKTYFIQSDIEPWLNPSDQMIQQIIDNFQQKKFSIFEQIHDVMAKAIQRRHALEKQINLAELPPHVNPKEFKDMTWTKTEEELLSRLTRIKALQVETSSKLNEEVREKALQRIEKHRSRYEEEILISDLTGKQNLILSNVLKAFASALDTHTAYFTPDEASQFMISVQQRLFGIGAQLRDDLNGFTVIKIIEGGPAALGKELKPKDRIIAVNGEPVVGMDIVSAVSLIRGEENTPVTLTVIRETKEDDKQKEEKLDIVVKRGEVVLKETRYNSSYQPFGKAVIAYLQLNAFYQDRETSSASDLTKAIQDLKKEHKLEGVILDLRYNSGGLLAQAVEVTGLFITKGIVVSIKDNAGEIQHLRDLNGEMVWGGPLIVLINRASASASEIVAQALQDYGRAIIVGDDHSYGKGTFQTLSLNATATSTVHPKGEFKVTRGKYYTVSGKTPQLTGVLSDIVVPGLLSETEIGEQYAKYPLENDKITSSYDDELLDVPFMQRNKIKFFYKFNLQRKLTTYNQYLETLKKNSAVRVAANKPYQSFLKQLKGESEDNIEKEMDLEKGEVDFQLDETYNILKDLLFLMSGNKKSEASLPPIASNLL